MEKRMRSYKSYMRKLEQDGDATTGYTRIPKKILIDWCLSEKERITWLMLASFLFRSENYIFPGRKKLAELLHLATVQQVSNLTKALCKKGYLVKYYNKNNRLIYELYFNADVDESIFFNKVSYEDEIEPSEWLTR
jgi:hypothetical protein